MKPEWHYFEAHINLAPVADKDNLKQTLDALGLRIVDLVEVRMTGLDSEEFGVITTMHEKNLRQLRSKVEQAVITLRERGYVVLRYKIESTVVDSKFHDALRVLPEKSDAHPPFDLASYLKALAQRDTYADRYR